MKKVDDLFAKLDANRDGKITPDELAAHLHRVYNVMGQIIDIYATAAQPAAQV